MKSPARLVLPAEATAVSNLADYFLDRHLREGRGHRVAVAGIGPAVTYAELAERAARVGALWCSDGLRPSRLPARPS